jgi:hypothetical protein
MTVHSIQDRKQRIIDDYFRELEAAVLNAVEINNGYGVIAVLAKYKPHAATIHELDNGKHTRLRGAARAWSQFPEGLSEEDFQ